MWFSVGSAVEPRTELLALGAGRLGIHLRHRGAGHCLALNGGLVALYAGQRIELHAVLCARPRVAADAVHAHELFAEVLVGERAARSARVSSRVGHGARVVPRIATGHAPAVGPGMHAATAIRTHGHGATVGRVQARIVHRTSTNAAA